VANSIVFLSDFGLREEYVGICHGVMAMIAPDVRIIDLTHEVPPHDIVIGALLLADSLPYVPSDSILLAVVDPGVGTERKDLAVETTDGRLLVGPDNGLMSLAWQTLGGVRRAVEISSAEVVLSPVSKTFHGRDVFAPAAAHLANGIRLEALGPPLDVEALITLSSPGPTIEPGRLECRVLDVDRFGNVRLDAQEKHLAAAGLEAAVELDVKAPSRSIRVRRVGAYGELGRGEYGVLLDSRGRLAIARDGASAAEGLDLRAGDPVWITARR
jgi:S-adenosyl-L-methionine hydrolase (adenosine-forming)